MNAPGAAAAETIYPTTPSPTTTAPTTGPPTNINAIVGTSVSTGSSEDKIDTTTVLIIAAAAVGGLIVLVGLAAVVCCCCIKTGSSRVEPSHPPAAGGAQYTHRPSTADWKSENMPKPQLTWSASWSELVGDEQGPPRAAVNAGRGTGSLRPIRGRVATTTTADHPARPAAAAAAKRPKPKPKSSIILPAANPTPTDGLTAADRRCSSVTTTTLPILR